MTHEHRIDATYSPEDNKLRLYATTRLDPETYARVREAGFTWAPKQELFVAPAWTPEREDLARELAASGEIDDEDRSLAERAEERAERFEDYRESRLEDATRARDAVARIADGIPMGQPILVGHHSERRARKDAERIENGMRKSIKAFETAQYWKARAAGAIAAAKYKELPGVRARRIKALAADLRKQEEAEAQSAKLIRTWGAIGTEGFPYKRKDGGFMSELEQALLLGNHFEHGSRCYPIAEYPRTAIKASKYEGPIGYWSAIGGNTEGDPPQDHAIISWQQAQALAIAAHGRTVARARRWVAHLTNRLDYERAMLLGDLGTSSEDSSAGPVAYAVGGSVLAVDRSGINRRRILRVTRRGGETVSLVLEGARRAVAVEAVSAYQPPTAEEAKATKAAIAKPPICNYPAESITAYNRYGRGSTVLEVEEWTAEEYAKLHTDYKATNLVEETPTQGAHRVRVAISNKKRSASLLGSRLVAVFLVDQKRKDPPIKTNPPTSSKDESIMIENENESIDPAVVDQVLGELGAGVNKDPAGQDFAENPPGWDKVEGGTVPDLSPAPEVTPADAIMKEVARLDAFDVPCSKCVDNCNPIGRHSKDYDGSYSACQVCGSLPPLARVATVKDEKGRVLYSRVPIVNVGWGAIEWLEDLSRGLAPRTVSGSWGGYQYVAEVEEVSLEDVNRAPVPPVEVPPAREATDGPDNHRYGCDSCGQVQTMTTTGIEHVNDYCNNCSRGEHRSFTRVPAGPRVDLGDGILVRFEPGKAPRSVVESLRDLERQGFVDPPGLAPRTLADDVQSMKESLRAGIKPVSAPNLFPTPPEVARRMVGLANLGPHCAGARILEPSAGTGRLLEALWDHAAFNIHAVEINRELAGQLHARFRNVTVHGADFLSLAAGEDLAPFDAVLMNPPFDHGSDVKHVRHALRFLKPGGILVGICANGPGQRRELEPLSDYWEELPSGTFAGTNVGAVLFRITLGQDGKPVPA